MLYTYTIRDSLTSTRKKTFSPKCSNDFIGSAPFPSPHVRNFTGGIPAGVSQINLFGGRKDAGFLFVARQEFLSSIRASSGRESKMYRRIVVVRIEKLHQFPSFVTEPLAPRKTTIGWTVVKTDPLPFSSVFLYRCKLHHVRKRKANLKDATSTPICLVASRCPFMS